MLVFMEVRKRRHIQQKNPLLKSRNIHSWCRASFKHRVMEESWWTQLYIALEVRKLDKVGEAKTVDSEAQCCWNGEGEPKRTWVCNKGSRGRMTLLGGGSGGGGGGGVGVHNAIRYYNFTKCWALGSTSWTHYGTWLSISSCYNGAWFTNGSEPTHIEDNKDQLK